jgi:microcystin degradation protein MlrC
VFLSQGVDPGTRDVRVVKSVQHFRAACAPIDLKIGWFDSAGIGSPAISRLKFEKLGQSTWPLDGVNDPYAGEHP